MERKDSIKKNIWIMNHYATNTFDDKAGRHYLFAKHLRKQGYNPTVFCANTYHDSRTSVDTRGNKYVVEEDANAKFVFVKTSEYKGNGFSRIKNMLNFTRNLMKVAKLYVKDGGEKPDVIIASSVHPLTCVAGIKIGKKLNVPCIVEIRDLWPESIVEYSPKLAKKKLVIKLLYKMEKWIYIKAEKIIFTMEGGKDYIVEKKWNREVHLNKIYHINNGVDLNDFDYNKEQFIVKDDDLENDEVIKVVYTGSISRVNNIGVILDAAKEITDAKVKFLLWGEGTEVNYLKERLSREKIINVVFKGKVDRKHVAGITTRANINLLHVEDNHLKQYGISHNKSFDYLASGKPILSTIMMNYDYISLNNAGVTIKKQESKEIAKAINLIINMKEENYKKMCQSARETSTQYDFKNLSKKLIEVIEA